MGIQDTLWRRGCKTGLYLVLNFPVFTGGDGRFEVDRKNGQVRTTGLPLQQDREYLLTVVAADQLGSRSIPAVLSVVAGSRPPQFSNTSFTIALPENTPAGQPWVHGTHRIFLHVFQHVEFPTLFPHLLCVQDERESCTSNAINPTFW